MRWRRNPSDEKIRGLERRVLAGDDSSAAIQLYYEWRRNGRIPQRPEIVVESPFGPVGVIPTSERIWLYAGNATGSHLASLPSEGHRSVGKRYAPRTSVPSIDLGDRLSLVAVYSRDTSGRWTEGQGHYHGAGIHTELKREEARPTTYRLRGARRIAEQRRAEAWRALERRAEEQVRAWASRFVPAWASANPDLLRAGDVAQVATEMEQQREAYEFHLEWLQREQESFARTVVNTLRAEHGLELLPDVEESRTSPDEAEPEDQTEPDDPD